MRGTRHFLLGPVLLLAGCYYDTEAKLYPAGTCDTTNVTWSATVQPIVQGNCAIPGCHVAGGTGTGDFTSYQGVKDKVDNGTFRQEVVVDGTMPPDFALSACEIQQLEVWIQAGAPQN